MILLNKNKDFYYDLICSIYEENERQDIRIDSHLICGGFKTEAEAIDYYDNNDCSKFNNKALEGQYPSIELETHGKNGDCIGVITID